MKKIIPALLFGLFSFSLFAQLISTEPPLPVITQPVVVTFNAAECSGGLAGYDGDVYAHTGLITQLSGSGSDWKYVKTNWGQNTPATKLTRIGQDLYELEISPSIREYYGVPASEKVLKMAFVFRSGVQVEGDWLEGKTEAGGDIFVDVYEAGLSVSFSKPLYFPVIVQLNESFTVEVNANEADNISLYIDETLVKSVAGYYLADTITASAYGKYLVKAVATNDTGVVADSFYYHVRPAVTVEALPAGIRDGINYTGDQTAILSLFAPYKNFIYVIGDFNNWDIEADYFMKKTPDGKRFWLEINGLTPGQEYVFQYYIDGQIRVGDPYADKISDPWNDEFISEETYPGLIPYPEGKTTGIATVLQTAQTPYAWEVETFTPASATDLVIYELLIRDFTSQHSYTALTDTLGYLERLGVNAIELMPVNEFEGNSSWGYNPSFYFAPDKYYGPKNELKRFVDECHKRGIAVFIDLVLNHSYDQSPMVQMYFDGNKPTGLNPWYNVDHNFTNTGAQWGNDFNHESPETQAFVDSVNSYWMSEYKIDGFRFDFTKGFGNNIKLSDDEWGSKYDADRVRLLKRMAAEIWERNHNAVVIFEHLAENLEEKELADYGILLWGNLNYSFAEAAMAYHTNNKSDFGWISYQKRTWNDPHLVGYMESHDEERIAYKCQQWGMETDWYNIREHGIMLRRLAMNAAFLLTIPGPRMIWQFGELGYDYSIDYNGRTGEKPVRWDYYSDYFRKYLYDFYSAMIRLRTTHPAFETDDFTLSVSSEMKKVVLEHPDMDVVLIGNFDVINGEIIPGFTHNGTWYEYFTGQTLEVTDVSAPVMLKHGEYRLYTDVPLETPQIGTGIGQIDINGSRLLNVWPNPSNNFSIDVTLNNPAKMNISIYDVSGQLVDHVYSGQLQSGQSTFIWSARQAQVNPGIYFCKASTNYRAEISKIVVK